ncbi:MAG: hypothetical protein QXI33_02815 [Candidatus Pacearchaeota archaeon]
MVKRIHSNKNQKFDIFSNVGLLRDVSIAVGGKNAAAIVDLLIDKKNVNEFIIAKKLNLTINQTRNILYKLSDEGLVNSIRKKDKKKGWYTYFWTFNADKAFLFLEKILLKEIEQLEFQLTSREVKRFYICPSCHSEVSEETALLYEFTCPECGEVYELNDNKQAIHEIRNNITRLRKKLEEVRSIISVIYEKKQKEFERDKKKIEKEKTERRKQAQLKKIKNKKKKI